VTPHVRHDTAATIRARVADLIEDDNPEDIDFVLRLIRSFIDRAPAMLDAIAAALAAGDAPATAELAHALKGLAANIGADQMARLSAEVEDHAANARLGDARSHVARIGDELLEANRQLSALGRSMSAQPN
jgi:histidine phosphotransfer protein HptB